MQTTNAIRWDKTTDDTGSLVYVDFCCPECGEDTGDMFLCRKYVSDAFETDMTCPVCGEVSTIVCLPETKETIFQF